MQTQMHQGGALFGKKKDAESAAVVDDAPHLPPDLKGPVGRYLASLLGMNPGAPPAGPPAPLHPCFKDTLAVFYTLHLLCMGQEGKVALADYLQIMQGVHANGFVANFSGLDAAAQYPVYVPLKDAELAARVRTALNLPPAAGAPPAPAPAAAAPHAGGGLFGKKDNAKEKGNGKAAEANDPRDDVLLAKLGGIEVLPDSFEARVVYGAGSVQAIEKHDCYLHVREVLFSNGYSREDGLRAYTPPQEEAGVFEKALDLFGGSMDRQTSDYQLIINQTGKFSNPLADTTNDDETYPELRAYRKKHGIAEDTAASDALFIRVAFFFYLIHAWVTHGVAEKEVGPGVNIDVLNAAFDLCRTVAKCCVCVPIMHNLDVENKAYYTFKREVWVARSEWSQDDVDLGAARAEAVENDKYYKDDPEAIKKNRAKVKTMGGEQGKPKGISAVFGHYTEGTSFDFKYRADFKYAVRVFDIDAKEDRDYTDTDGTVHSTDKTRRTIVSFLLDLYGLPPEAAPAPQGQASAATAQAQATQANAYGVQAKRDANASMAQELKTAPKIYEALTSRPGLIHHLPADDTLKELVQKFNQVAPAGGDQLNASIPEKPEFIALHDYMTSTYKTDSVSQKGVLAKLLGEYPYSQDNPLTDIYRRYSNFASFKSFQESSAKTTAQLAAKNKKKPGAAQVADPDAIDAAMKADDAEAPQVKADARNL